jgi:hypothetical protein
MMKTKDNPPETVVKKTNSSKEEKVPIIKDKISVEFLLKEYERLVEYQKLTIDDYNRWFNVYA